jgi:uncharacterized protein (TIGR00725 family)
MGYGRNVIVARSAQAVIAIGGSYGTLSEIGYALQGGVPVIGLDTWEFSRGCKPDKSITRVSTPAEAVALAMDMINDHPKEKSKACHRSAKSSPGKSSIPGEIPHSKLKY